MEADIQIESIVRPVKFPESSLPLAAYSETHDRTFGLFYQEMVIDSGIFELKYPEYWMNNEITVFSMSSFDWKSNGILDLVIENGTQLYDEEGWPVMNEFFMCVPDFYLDSSRTHYNCDPHFNISGSTPLPLLYQPAFDMADLDDDSDTDIVISVESRLFIRWNTGSDSIPHWEEGILLPHSFSGIRSISLNDFDHDNDFDLLISGNRLSQRNKIFFVENIGTPNNPQFSSNIIPIFDIEGYVDFADLDNDDDLDFVVKHIISLYQVGWDCYRNDSSDTSFVFTRIESCLPPYLSNGVPHLVDFDNDHDTDLFIITNEGKLYLVQNISITHIPEKDLPLLPKHFFFQNYPNPFNSSTTIHFELPCADKISLTIYNVQGQKVKTFLVEKKPVGKYLLTWDGKNERDIEVSSGIYFCRLQSGNFAYLHKLLLIR